MNQIEDQCCWATFVWWPATTRGCGPPSQSVAAGGVRVDRRFQRAQCNHHLSSTRRQRHSTDRLTDWRRAFVHQRRVPAPARCSTLVGEASRQSLSFKEGAGKTPDGADLLPKQKCLEALAHLRHAKWFQVRLSFSLFIATRPHSFPTIPIVASFRKVCFDRGKYFVSV